MDDTQTAVLEQVDHADPEHASVASVPEPDLGYRVEIDSFSGPLDLLLYLVRRTEVDIADIPIAAIADQFIATIRQWEEMDLDLAGDFILMAATLLEIKARTIAPAPEGEEMEDEDDELIDPRADLIRQLLAFRACKDWSDGLLDLEEAEQQRHRRRFREDIPEAAEADAIELESVDPYQLYRIWDGILADIAGKGPRTVVYDDVPIEDRVRQILSVMQEAGEGRLSWLLAGVTSRIKRVGIFVALLTAVRQRALITIQHDQYADVYLEYVAEAARQAPAHETAPLVLEEATRPEEPRKRRRRGPIRLVTYQMPMVDEEGQQEVLAEAEEQLKPETEEDRFRRDLNHQTGCDDVLGTMQSFDFHLQEHLIRRGICQGPLPAGQERGEAAAAELSPDTEDAQALAG